MENLLLKYSLLPINGNYPASDSNTLVSVDFIHHIPTRIASYCILLRFFEFAFNVLAMAMLLNSKRVLTRQQTLGQLILIISMAINAYFKVF